MPAAENRGMRRLILLLVVAGDLVLAACGGDQRSGSVALNTTLPTARASRSRWRATGA